MITAAICDDEKVFVDKLVLLLEEYTLQHGIDIKIKKYYDVDSLLEEVNDNYQIIFLDVKLGAMNGIEVARELRKRRIDSVIIYISAYIEMAPMGYEVNALRYILKNDLERVLNYTLDDAFKEVSQKNRCYEIKTQGKSEFIELEKIMYFTSFKRYVEIYTEDKVYKQYRKISDLELELETRGFIRTHKSYLVNMQYIEFFKNREICLKNGTALPCSKTDYQKLKQKYILWKGKN